MNKDIIGILFFKTKCMNLRLVCREFDEWIRGLNVYWFVTYFKYNSFRILKKHGDIKHTRTVSIIVPEGKNCKLPLLSCLTDKPRTTLDREMKAHPLYSTWLQEAKNLQFFVKSYEEDYCRYQYLSHNKIICNSPSHYSSFRKHDLKMHDINSLPPDIAKYYDNNIKYFYKL